MSENNQDHQQEPKKEKPEFEFRIIAGSLKQRRIVAPDLGVTRPPLTRLRKSIFDYLRPYLTDANYLDLFSGTGAYLFEAVSRGVKSATGVELEPKLVDSINRQAAKFDVADRLECRHQDVFEAIPQLADAPERFDIIMIAPPQYRGFIDRTLRLIAQYPLLSPNGQIICQHDSSETRKLKWPGFELAQQRKYGNTTFTILKLAVEPPSTD